MRWYLAILPPINHIPWNRSRHIPKTNSAILDKVKNELRFPFCLFCLIEYTLPTSLVTYVYMVIMCKLYCCKIPEDA